VVSLSAPKKRERGREKKAKEGPKKKTNLGFEIFFFQKVCVKK
jgi:hypothetical protein